MNRESLHRGLGVLILAAGVAAAAGGVWAWQTTDDWGYVVQAGIFGLAMILIGWSRFKHVDPPPLAHPEDDPLLVQAASDARRSIATFLDGLNSRNYEPLIKFSVENVEGDTEHVWALVHSVLEPTAFIVSVISDPLAELVLDGARQVVSVDELEDWMLTDSDGQIQGAFSEKAMAQIFERDHGYVPKVVQEHISWIVDDRKDPPS